MERQVSITAILDIIRRRKMFLIVPFVTILLFSVVSTFVLPKQYESYTTMLLERDQTKDPLMDYWTKSSMNWNWDNQLGKLNEILLSRTSVESLLDSLGHKRLGYSNQGWDAFIAGTRRQIGTSITGTDGFRISFVDKDANVTQRAAQVLCNIYIQTTLRSDRQQAEETVNFLDKKVEQLRSEFEEQQREYLGTRQRNLSSQPQEEGALRPQLVRISEDLSGVERTLEQQTRALNQIRTFRENLDNPTVISQIAALEPRGAVLYVDTLKAVSVRYNQLLMRYTMRYPQVLSARKDLAELLQKSSEALEEEIQNSKAKRSSLQNSREEMIRGISTSINTGSVTAERGSEFMRVKENYEMVKQSLDQAKVKKELTDRGASRFVILDAAQVPSSPSKPKKRIIVGGGAALGLLAGLAAMFLVEYFDPTIRRRQDIEVFNRPIIGYIP